MICNEFCKAIEIASQLNDKLRVQTNDRFRVRLHAGLPPVYSLWAKELDTPLIEVSGDNLNELDNAIMSIFKVYNEGYCRGVIDMTLGVLETNAGR